MNPHMPEQPRAARKRFGIFRGKAPAPGIEPWEAARQRETAAGLALLEEIRRKERDERRLRLIYTMWPVGLGIVISAFAPLLKIAAEGLSQWAMTLIFPFVVLAARPELQAGPITHSLPTIMLYAQFPIEGLLARLILKPHVRPISVTIQVLLFHFLGIVEVWLLGGAAQGLMNR